MRDVFDLGMIDRIGTNECSLGFDPDTLAAAVLPVIRKTANQGGNIAPRGCRLAALRRRPKG